MIPSSPLAGGEAPTRDSLWPLVVVVLATMTVSTVITVHLAMVFDPALRSSTPCHHTTER